MKNGRQRSNYLFMLYISPGSEVPIDAERFMLLHSCAVVLYMVETPESHRYIAE